MVVSEIARKKINWIDQFFEFATSVRHTVSDNCLSILIKLNKQQKNLIIFKMFFYMIRVSLTQLKLVQSVQLQWSTVVVRSTSLQKPHFLFQNRMVLLKSIPPYLSFRYCKHKLVSTIFCCYFWNRLPSLHVEKCTVDKKHQFVISPHACIVCSRLRHDMCKGVQCAHTHTNIVLERINCWCSFPYLL